MREYLLVMLVAAAVTYLLTPLVRRGAVLVGAQHVPRERDMHSKPTPLLGGVAMYGGLAAGLLVTQRLSYLQQAFPSGRYVEGLLLAAGLLVIVGIIDDRWGMGAITKMAGQVAAGGILIWSGVEIPWIPTPSGGEILFTSTESVTLTIVLIVVTVNAVNFIDGLDGLAAGIVAVAALAFLIYSYLLDRSVGLPSQSLAAVSSALLVGMCFGFLPHNFPPAKIFMGDTGSMLLGLLLAYAPIVSLENLNPFLLSGSSGYLHHPLNRFPTVVPLLIPVAILVIPYMDMMLAVVRRTRAGKSPWTADKEHLHHRLMGIGHSQRQSVLIMYVWATLFAGIVVALSVMRTGLIWIAIVSVAAVLVLLPATMPRLRPGYRREAREREARAGRNARSPHPADAPSIDLPSAPPSAPATPTFAPAPTSAPAAPPAPSPAGVPSAPGVPSAYFTPNPQPAPSAPQPPPGPRSSTTLRSSATPGAPTTPRTPTAAPAGYPAPGPFPPLEPFPGDGEYRDANPFPPADLFPTAGAPTGHLSSHQPPWSRRRQRDNGQNAARDRDPAE
jgi:UDP-GlcNAc:undecaprenyl-phosphate/decaprenyl-phosphate GlcNAc-1-phosphate transferase